jgi:MarR family transcriptional regulator, 2-MHQ and catechol-resistance regulon repressor
LYNKSFADIARASSNLSGFLPRSNIERPAVRSESGAVDIVATLGNTSGMNLLQLSNKTLLTQPALLKTLEKLIAQSMVAKDYSTDHPVAIFRLTEIGEKVFHVSFSVHMQYLQERFGQLEEAEIEFLQHVLKHLRRSFMEDLG